MHGWLVEPHGIRVVPVRIVALDRESIAIAIAELGNRILVAERSARGPGFLGLEQLGVQPVLQNI